MRRRIYWLLPDLASARRTMNDLLLARVAEPQLHFVAREGADMAGLHAANVLQTSDLLRSAQLGLVVGGFAGLVTGVVASLAFPLAGESGFSALRAVLAAPQWGAADLLATFDSPQWGMAAVLALLGAVVGAWSSSMIGISVPSHRLQRFEAALEQGRILLMVDVPRSRVAEIDALLRAAHPEAHYEGLEPDMPAFP